MSSSYDLENTIQRAITDIVEADFRDYGFDVNDLGGSLTLSASIAITLPEGWEFAGYNDSLEIERSLSI